MRGEQVITHLRYIPVDDEGMEYSSKPRVVGRVADVSPVGVEIRTDHGKRFFFPWSNVTGVEYLDDAAE